MSEALAASNPRSPCSRAFMDMQWCMWRRDILGLTKHQPLKQFLSLLLEGPCRYSVGMEEN